MASLHSLVLTAACMALAGHAFSQALEPDHARPGNDYMRLAVERCEVRKCSATASPNAQLACVEDCRRNDDSAALCMQTCVGDPFCRAFTYQASNAQCYLKSDAGAAIVKKGSTSGAVVRAPKPFHVVILGDSVMWGQGLSVDQKFTTRTVALLQNNRWARPLGIVFNQSHSGASLGEIGDADAGVDLTPSYLAQGIPETVVGEIPRTPPVVWQQEQTVLDRMTNSGGVLVPDDVAWVMMDGGANDVGFVHTIVDSDIVPQSPDASVDSIQGRTQRFAGARMLPILNKVCSDFKNANVVVTGYYAVLDASDPIRSSGFWGDLVAVYGYFDWKMSLGFVMPAYDLSARSLLFANYINFDLQNATNLSTGCKGRVIFVSPEMSGFEDNVQNIFTPANDPVSIPRKGACDTAWGLNPLSSLPPKITCESASLFHPNHLGADRYYQRIRQGISTAYPGWVSPKRKMVVDRTFSGNKVAVSAFDAETRAQLYGAVLVSGRTSADPRQSGQMQHITGETDQVIEFQPCYRAPALKHCPSAGHGHANCDREDPSAALQPVACGVSVTVGGYEE